MIERKQSHGLSVQFVTTERLESVDQLTGNWTDPTKNVKKLGFHVFIKIDCTPEFLDMMSVYIYTDTSPRKFSKEYLLAAQYFFIDQIDTNTM